MVAQTNHQINKCRPMKAKSSEFTNGDNLGGKTPPGEFKVTTLENPLLSKQAVTSKGIPIPYTNL